MLWDDDEYVAMELKDWLDSCLLGFLEESMESNVTVITLVGQNSLDRRRTAEIDEFLQFHTFPVDERNPMKLELFYSQEESTVFIVLNGPNDIFFDSSHLQESDDEGDSNFLENLKPIDEQYILMLLFVFMVSHHIIFMEPSPRLDMTMVRSLKKVNKLRTGILAYLRDNTPGDGSELYFLKDCRVALPKIYLACHRNVVRSELGHQKKKEIYEKLERSIEDQIRNVFRHCGLIENQNSTQSLCDIPFNSQFVHLLLPQLVNNNPISDLLDLHQGVTATEIEQHRATSESFSIFLRNIKSPKHLKNNALSLQQFYQTAKWLYDCLWTDFSGTAVERCLSTTSGQGELYLLEQLTNMHVDGAFARYSRGLSKDSRMVITKNEHLLRLGAAVTYLDSVLVGPREEAMNRLRVACEDMWQGGLQGCEQQSVTGNNCQLALHPCVGDKLVPEEQWELHDSCITFISTCSCGRSQTLRRDPFTLKEANYDFYHSNHQFSCCEGLQRHAFTVLEKTKAVAEKEEQEEWTAAEENWQHSEVPPTNVVTVLKSSTSKPNPVHIRSTSADSMDNGELTEEFSHLSTNSNANDESQNVFRSYLDVEEKVNVKALVDDRRKAIVTFEKRLMELEESGNRNFLLGVPHSTTLGLKPLFPSWTLTCIGPSNIYSHAFGLRDQPNFKIASEYLLPVDIHLKVDPDSWDRDMDYVHAMEGGGGIISAAIVRSRKPRRAAHDVEKVKLFVGFDYECPRGHRFFVNHEGEPLLLSKGHRETICREAGTAILGKDLPLRRQCTCRKLPNQVAQLSKIHIVTPKAPVSVTLDPKIFIPSQDGYFCTGERELSLKWSKYYILQLPFIYSGPNGIWYPPATFEKVGILKSNSIRVAYRPIVNS